MANKNVQNFISFCDELRVYVEEQNQNKNDMLTDSVIIENFRGYQARQVISFSDITDFVGRNDVDKSTILEALDIFFYYCS